MDIQDAGTLLYWCEGSKRELDYRVEFVNSDPRMISLFMKFIRTKGIDEKRLRIRLTIHVQDNEEACKKYWKKIVLLKDSNFMETIVKKPSVSRKPIPYGTVTIRYNSISVLREIKEDISRLVKRLS